MDTTRTERRLAAILSADVVGYSRLMGEDDARTVGQVKACRAIVEAVVRRHGGRVVDAVGDNLLAELPSAVDAVECAVAVQGELAEQGPDLPEERRMRLRIGLNLGDVIVDGDQIYGDGINVAARLEALAEPGGVSISGTVFDHVEGKLGLRFRDEGEHEVKNIRRPVRVYRVETSEVYVESARCTVPGFAGRPAIAVLPFDELSGDPAKEYFADGLTEGLISRLSCQRRFPVIARNSTATYRGRAVDLRQIGRELGVRYVVEGSVRRAGERIRVRAQLVDATTSHHLWAQKYDRTIGDVFDLQDEITLTISAAIAPELRRIEPERSLHRSSRDLDAWDLLQRGIWHLRREEEGSVASASEHFAQALELDPSLALARGFVALCRVIEVSRGRAPRAGSLDQATSEIRAALEQDELDPELHCIHGTLSLHRGEGERAIQAFGRSIELDPSFALAHSGLGKVLAVVGRTDEAFTALERALRLSPNDPLRTEVLADLGVAHFTTGDYERSIQRMEESRVLRPLSQGDTGILTAAYSHAGRRAEARAELERLLELVPALTLAAAEDLARTLLPTQAERIVEGLRLAGLR